MPKKTRKEKEKIVEDLRAMLERQQAVYVTKMGGLSVAEANTLRRAMKSAGGEFKVTKLTLLKIASQGTQFEEVARDLVGPMAVVVAYDDPVSVAKFLKSFVKDVPKLEIVTGMLSGKEVTAQEIASLADLPPREELIAKAVGTISAPLNNLVGTLAAMPRQLLYALHAIKDKKEAA